MEDVDQPALDQLGLRQWGGDAQKGFVGKQTVPSGMAWTSPVKRKSAQIVDQVVAEASGAFEPIDIGGRKAQGLEIGESVLKARARRKSRRSRQPPHEELKRRSRSSSPLIQIGLARLY